MLPLHQEQKLLADALQAQGIGLQASISNSAELVQSVDTMLNIQHCSKAMSAIAEKYKNFNAKEKQQAFCQMLLSEIDKNISNV
jgi:hypothetical protein